MLGQVRAVRGAGVRRRRWLSLPKSKETQKNAAMAQTMPFKIGAYANCTDGARGQVSRIIVNPITREVTHLAVDPSTGMARDGLFLLTS
jgi:hypothetical protein